LLEKNPPDKHPVDKIQEVPQTGNPGGGGSSALDDIVQRVTRLEQEFGGAAPTGEAGGERRGRRGQ
jgi:hypothetical protein